MADAGATPPGSPDAPPPAAVLFDTFGTVVDWRSSVIAEAGRLLGADPSGRGWADLADRWRREGYSRPLAAMAAGQVPFEPVDDVLRRHLQRLLDEAGVRVDVGTVDALTGVWYRLEPWPDAVAGLTRLRSVAVIGTLSNGSFGGLARMARTSGLPWHCVISAQQFGSYKPDPVVYRGAAELLGLRPDQVTLVAAHPGDLRAARGVGLRTAYVHRPLEWGPDATPGEPDTGAGIRAGDLEDLASRYGA